MLQGMRRPLGGVLVHAISIELPDDDAVDPGNGFEQPIGFKIEDQAQPLAGGAGGNDERPRQLDEQPAPIRRGIGRRRLRTRAPRRRWGQLVAEVPVHPNSPRMIRNADDSSSGNGSLSGSSPARSRNAVMVMLISDRTSNFVSASARSQPPARMSSTRRAPSSSFIACRNATSSWAAAPCGPFSS